MLFPALFIPDLSIFTALFLAFLIPEPGAFVVPGASVPKIVKGEKRPVPQGLNMHVSSYITDVLWKI